MPSVNEDFKQRWRTAYNNGFYVARTTPSLICQDLSYYMELPGHVLDVGAGNGRNSVFFARMGYGVDAVDVVDIFPSEYKEHGLITFTEAEAEKFVFEKEKYLAVVATRFLQYISSDIAKILLENWYMALRPKGYVALSFVVNNSSVQGVKGYDVPYYYHDPEKVIETAEKVGFGVITKKSVNQMPLDVNRIRKKLIDSFEVIFQKSN
ncbi:MAG: class I SAM-dependent methyltransferase [Patescibacteria group bacterium]|nr:class I SAM-dependent methyltransferase [Patescibacteria group bacterium]